MFLSCFGFLNMYMLNAFWTCFASSFSMSGVNNGLRGTHQSNFWNELCNEVFSSHWVSPNHLCCVCILQTLQLDDNSTQGGSQEDLCVTNLKVFFILLAFQNVQWKLQCWVHLSGDCGELHEWSQLLSGVCWSSCCHLWWTVSQVVFFLYVFFIHVPQDYH